MTVTSAGSHRAPNPVLKPASKSGLRSPIGRWVREHLVTFFGILALVYLFVPIFVVVLFSFNDPTEIGRAHV